MNKLQFRNFVEQKFKEILSTMDSGQKEYALSEDAFDNFNRLAAELGIDRKQVLMIYFSKHRDGVISYLKGHRSQREPVQGRIKDMNVYMFLLWAMIEEEEEQQNQHGSFKEFTSELKQMNIKQNDTKRMDTMIYGGVMHEQPPK